MKLRALPILAALGSPWARFATFRTAFGEEAPSNVSGHDCELDVAAGAANAFEFLGPLQASWLRALSDRGGMLTVQMEYR